HHQGRLQYASRARATEALRRVGQEPHLRAGQVQDSMTDEDGAIHEGFNIIHQYIEQHAGLDRNAIADFLRARVTVVRASLPPKTDLNRYFEIMNTRGEQLQPVDIVKARLMSHLPDPERAVFAWIWDACADMDTYVQMALTRGNTALRETIFGAGWSWLVQTDFAALCNVHAPTQTSTAVAMPSQPLSLDAALQKYAHGSEHVSGTEEINERFRSTIEFPVFLLHVLKVKSGGDDEDEGHLDDKRLIQSFTTAIKNSPGKEAQWVQDFAFTLLRCRNLFDSFILKRQFAVSAEDDEGDWSLQRLKKNVSNGKSTSGYVHVFRPGDASEESEPDSGTCDVLLLQSMLRITYTSPRTMHWITQTLQWLVRQEKPGTITSAGLVDLLQNYARAKVKSAFFDTKEPSDEQPNAHPQGFGIARIVFTYLDYLLLDEATKKDFKFQFRTSIEHFYPQHPDKEQSGADVTDKKLHLLGNLALVSVGANSKFSNSFPKAKAENFKDTIAQQSPKLRQMADIALRDGWGDAQVQAHHNAMLTTLQNALGPHLNMRD
ncbi:MAG TPA: HNH endonuclease family protein, partial [Comamonas denitrificans]|nr:HNH endonuclease family protein [Comamonas denitrificans]